MRTRAGSAFPFAFRTAQGNLTYHRAKLEELWYRVQVFDIAGTMDSPSLGGPVSFSASLLNLFSAVGNGPFTESEIQKFYSGQYLYSVSGASMTLELDWRPTVGDPLGNEYRALCSMQIQIGSTIVYSATVSPDSAFTGECEGATIGFSDYDHINDPVTGSVTITPVKWWEYRRSDNSRPIWGLFTGASLLPSHQTDELP